MVATKDQERKALEKIRKIVEELGEGSYVGTAFEGCFEIAEENINNDWALSMKQNFEAALKEQGQLRVICQDYDAEVRGLEAENKELKKEIEQLRTDLDDSRSISLENYNTGVDNYGKYKREEAKVEELEKEIIKLKAKLYDLICKEA